MKKLSEKVSLVTMERKSQGKTVPEDQVTADISKFQVKGRFGQHAQYLATTSMDRTLKIYSPETPALAGW